MAKDAAESLAGKLKKHCSDNGRGYCDPVIWLYDFATGVIGEELEMTPGVTRTFPAKSGERLKAMAAIAEYLYPKQKSMDMNLAGGLDAGLTVQIVRYGGDESFDHKTDL